MGPNQRRRGSKSGEKYYFLPENEKYSATIFSSILSGHISNHTPYILNATFK